VDILAIAKPVEHRVGIGLTHPAPGDRIGEAAAHVLQTYLLQHPVAIFRRCRGQPRSLLIGQPAHRAVSLPPPTVEVAPLRCLFGFVHVDMLSRHTVDDKSMRPQEVIV